MFSLNSKKLLLTVFLLLLIAAVSFLNFPNIKLLIWGVNLNLPSWQSYNLGGENSDSIELISDNSRVRIVKSIAENKIKFINDKKKLLKLIFEPTTSPYPEFITNIIDCGNEFKPKEEAVKNGVIYNIFAGERFNYGICSQDLIKYHSRYGIFDCGDKGIFEINLFSKNGSEIDKIVKSFKCNL